MGRSTYNTRHAAHSALVTIKSGSATYDSTYGPDRTLGTAATRYATIRTLSGEEFETINKAFGTATHEITMRYYALKPEDTITYGSRTFNIVQILNSEERAFDTRVIVKEIKNG